MEPFKVICVAKLNTVSIDGAISPVPSITEECLVLSEKDFVIHTTGRIMHVYQLSGYPSHVGYNAAAFATLPGLTADEMNELEKEAIIK